MNFRVLTQDLAISSRRFVAATLLVSGALAWFFLLSLYLIDILTSITSDSSWVVAGQVLFFGTGVLSAILGSIISRKLDRRKFLWSWIILGVISTASLVLFQGIGFAVLSSILLGLSLGLGLPSSFAVIADCTSVEGRGRIAGTSILMSFLFAFIAIAIVEILGSELFVIVLLCTVVRSASFLALVLDKSLTGKLEDKSRMPKPGYKELSLYLFPWIMFVIASIVASNLIPHTDEFQSAVSTGTVFRYALIAVFGFIWGVVADRVGRKPPIYVGLVVLGISFTLLGVSMTPLTVLVYLALSGVAWGSFLTIYLVIPGDLSIPGYREKFYALGTISPLIIMFSLMLLLTAANTSLLESSFSHFLSIILYLSVIPVFRSKETLQESKIQERKLKEHVKKVGKIIKESEEPGEE